MSTTVSMSTSAGEEGEKEEAVVQLTVSGVSRLEDVAFSKTVKLRGHQWRLMVVHREVNAKGSDGKKDVMGAYIQHVGPKTAPQASNWNIVINASITLVNQLDADKSYTRDFRHQYTHNSTDWGYSNFLRWKDVMSPHRGFVKDDTIVLGSRLIYPGPDARPDPTPSPSQSHSTSSPLSVVSPAAQFTSHTSYSRGSSTVSLANSRTHPLSVSSSQSLSFSQMSSQDPSELTQLTSASTSVLPPEMASFLTCPRCTQHYEEEGERSPNTLHCGHTFCLGCLERLLTVKGEEEGKQKLTCNTCDKEHTVDSSSDKRPWFPNHSMIQLITSVLSKAKHFCPTHQHDRNYYCLQDKMLVCIYCAYHGEHAGHQCQPVGEAKQTIRDGLRSVRIQAQGRMTELERRLQLMKDEQEGVRVQAQNSAHLVEDYFTNLETAVRKQRDLLLKDLHTHTTHLHTSIQTRVRDLEKHFNKVQRSLEEYDKWKSLPAWEALTNVPAITHTLQSAASASLPRDLQHGSSPQLRVCVELPCTNPLSSLGPLGHVTVTWPSPSTSPGAVERPGKQEAQASDVVNGNRQEESQDNQWGDETRDVPPLLADTDESITITVTDTQEGEAPVRREVVKRTLLETSPGLELQTKKRKK